MNKQANETLTPDNIKTVDESNITPLFTSIPQQIIILSYCNYNVC